MPLFLGIIRLQSLFLNQRVIEWSNLSMTLSPKAVCHQEMIIYTGSLLSTVISYFIFVVIHYINIDKKYIFMDFDVYWENLGRFTLLSWDCLWRTEEMFLAFITSMGSCFIKIFGKNRENSIRPRSSSWIDDSNTRKKSLQNDREA